MQVAVCKIKGSHAHCERLQEIQILENKKSAHINFCKWYASESQDECPMRAMKDFVFTSENDNEGNPIIQT